MSVPLPYCGAPPLPSELLTRFNWDPVLIVTLCALATLQLLATRRARGAALAGWSVALAAWVSPLCALSVALFSARIAQHMILLLAAAPLIARAWPPRRPRPARWPLWASAVAFLIALWYWHMPLPYESTFRSTLSYWCMHVSLFGSGIWLWRELLHPRAQHAAEVFIAGALSSMQMGFLGAILALAGRALFSAHLLTTAAWGMTPLQDQQLGGALMWVPGIALFLWVGIRSLERQWSALDQSKAT